MPLLLPPDALKLGSELLQPSKLSNSDLYFAFDTYDMPITHFFLNDLFCFQKMIVKKSTGSVTRSKNMSDLVNRKFNAVSPFSESTIFPVRDSVSTKTDHLYTIDLLHEHFLFRIIYLKIGYLLGGLQPHDTFVPQMLHLG